MNAVATPAFLQEILKHKREEIAERKRRHGIDELRDWGAEQGAARGFARSLKDHVERGRPAVVAELKRASTEQRCLARELQPARNCRGVRGGGRRVPVGVDRPQVFQGVGRGPRLGS